MWPTMNFPLSRLKNLGIQVLRVRAVCAIYYFVFPFPFYPSAPPNALFSFKQMTRNVQMQTSGVRSSIKTFSLKCYFLTKVQQERKHYLSPILNVCIVATL